MNMQQLRERYAAPEIPKCRVCGGVLTVQRAGGGPTIWGCTGMIDDPTGERNWIYAEGRSCADEHYERSRWSDYRQGGDADVIELIDALEAAEKLAEFRLKSINSMDALVAGRNNRIAELESWVRAVEESMISASDRAEAAERERDELKQRLANAEHQLHMAELPKFNLRNQRKAQFRKRREAEAELARRDAAAGEPDYWQFKSVNGDWIGIGESGMRQAVSEGVEVRPLYTAASPAVLPPEKITEIMQGAWNEFCDDTGCYPDDFEYQNEQLFFDAGRWAMLVAERISRLGAQQQKVVELPTSFTVIGENIRSQNNRCTADPIFCVFEKVPTPAAEGYNHTRIEWYDSDHDRDATPLQAARLEALFDGGRCDDNDYKCWRRLAMHDVDTFVTACFTFKGCEDYLAQNGHNLRQPFVYVTSAYRNDEYKAVREWMMQLAAAPAPGGDYA